MPDPELALPRDKDQRNFTDPESRLMIDGATKAFTQACNAHAAVDEENQIILADPRLAGVECYVPPGRRTATPAAHAMRAKLAEGAGKEIYNKRKAIVESVFGQIKEARGFRHFGFRGLAAVNHEWELVCMTHNLLKLHNAGVRPVLA